MVKIPVKGVVNVCNQKVHTNIYICKNNSFVLMPAYPASCFALMDRYGTEKIPFLFVISFDGTMTHVWREDEIPGWVEFSVPGIGELKAYKHCPFDFHFTAEPVEYNDYLITFNEVMQHILRGDTFLINLTFPTKIDMSLSMNDVYEYSHAPYKIKFGDYFVCFSPETFVRVSGDVIKTCPMKGTIDAEIPDAEKLILSDVKETAEHNTIVDLLRNDLGIVADDIRVNRFRYVETVKGTSGPLLQVSSEIEGRIRAGYRGKIGSIFSLILPAGSVTGAPKKKTVEIIKKVETYDRGYYTGVFGWFDGYNLDSAVLIRFIEKTEKGLFFKSGGGITSLSKPRDEYNELIKKVYVPFPRNDQN